MPVLFHKINMPLEKNNLLIKSIILLILFGIGFVLYSYLIHTLSLFIASGTGALAAGYILRIQAKAQQKKNYINALHQAKYHMHCIKSCNEKFQLHRTALNDSSLVPWEQLIHYYDFQTVLLIPLEPFSFLSHLKEGNSLFELFLSINTDVTRINKALIDLHQAQYHYVEKMTQWESKIKTMKALRELNSTEAKKVCEKIGVTLHKQLHFLTDFIVSASDELATDTPHALDKINNLLSNQ